MQEVRLEYLIALFSLKSRIHKGFGWLIGWLVVFSFCFVLLTYVFIQSSCSSSTLDTNGLESTSSSLCDMNTLALFFLKREYLPSTFFFSVYT